MTCEALRSASAGDDPSDRAALEAHAGACAACAAFLREERWLAEQVEAWRDEAPTPPESLQRRIAATLAREALSAAAAPGPRRRARRIPIHATRRLWMAAAAVAVVLAGASMMMLRSLTTEESQIARAVRNAEKAASRHARAIAELERRAVGVLGRAGDPALGSRQAAILLTYRDRLSHLDSVIAQVEGFLKEHPGHSGGHTVLTAAYEEKADVLREVLAFKFGELS